jgi:site-specific recombinase XerD
MALYVIPGALSDRPIKMYDMGRITKQSAADIADFTTAQQAAGKPRSTLYLRSWQLRRFAEDYPGSIRAATTPDLARHLARDDWSPATKYSVRATFRSFYAYLAAAGRIRRNPALDLPTIKRPILEPNPAPEDVVRTTCVDPRVQLMVDLGARQGLRRCEIVAIHSRDLRRDLLGWSLVVHGKGARERTIPLHDDIAARIIAAGPGWLFPSPSPNSQTGHLAANYAGVLISRELKGWTAHSLRRRFATKINAETHDLRAIQKMLGHASLATTQRYVGTDAGQLRDALHHAA